MDLTEYPERSTWYSSFPSKRRIWEFLVGTAFLKRLLIIAAFPLLADCAGANGEEAMALVANAAKIAVVMRNIFAICCLISNKSACKFGQGTKVIQLS